MLKYTVYLVGVNVTVNGLPMQPDKNWTLAAKAAIELSSGPADRNDHSRMSVHEIAEAALDPNWSKKVKLIYDRDIITVKNLFETLAKVDAEVELDILLRPEEGSAETEEAGLMCGCTFDLFTIEKMPEGPKGFLDLEFKRFSNGQAVQIFTKEVAGVLN